MGYTPNEWHPLDVITSEKLNELEKGLTKTSENVVYGSGGAQQSSDGIHSLKYIEKGDALPSKPQVGDTVFMIDGNDFSILEWDGEQWNNRVDPKLSDRIQTALDEAKDNAETLINNNNTSINTMVDQVTKDKIAAALKDADFNNKAQAMADKALQDAKANTATVAQETLNSANNNIAASKAELITNLNKEVTDRANAVTSLDTKAKGYADTAKADAISASTTALNTAKTDLTNSIASEASARNQAVSAANSQAQTYANQAKADALNAVTKEVSDRQNAVSALDTKATNAVNQAKSDINDTIKAISVGGRNLVLGTETDTAWTADSAKNFSYKVIATGLKPNQTYTFSAEVTLGNTDQKNTTIALFNAPIGQLLASTYIKADGTRDHWTFTVPSTVNTPTASLIIYAGQAGITGGKSATYHHIKLETGNLPTDWTPAPEDVVLDYTTKDNQIKATITQYQTTNDGKVTKAQTDATTALGQVATKVSQTDYDTKTGDLDSKYTAVKQTVDQASTDITAIKQKDGEQDAKMNSIVSDANGTKQTVSDLQTTQGKQSGDLSTLKQRADGFDATVTKVDNLSIGGRNYLTGTGNTNSTVGANVNNQSKALYKITLSSLDALYKEFKKTSNYFTLIFDWTYTGTNPSGQFIPQWNMPPYGFTGKYVTISSSNTGGTAIYTEKVLDIWSGVTGLPYIQMRFDNISTTGTVTISNMRLMSGNMSYPWTPAPEDVDSATAKAQLTADNATTSLNNYKTDADGRITKAQSDITQTAKDVTTKVSQTDYNAKTGDLTTKVNTAQSTADSANSTISAYKTSNDGRVASAESKISQNTTDITTKVSQTAYNAKTNQLQTDLNTTTTTANKATTDIVSINQKDSSQDARMTTIESDANGTKTTVSNLQTDLGKANGSISTLQQRADGFDATVTKVNGLSIGGRNYIISSKLNSYAPYNTTPIATNGGKTITTTYISATVTYLTIGISGFKPIGQYTMSGKMTINGTPVTSVTFTNQVTSTYNAPYTATDTRKIDDNGNFVFTETYQGRDSWLMHTPITGIKAGDVIVIENLKFEKGNKATDWTPAPEDVDSATAKAQFTADQATTTINTYKTSNDGRVASAESKITQNANAITQKVSQTDYDKKTGDLTTAVSKAQTTADGVVTTVGNYKTSNDARVKATETSIAQNAKDITARVSQTDYNKATGKLSSDISILQQRADGFDATVTKVDNLAIGGRNLYLNSRMVADGYSPNGSVKVTVEPFDNTTNMWHIVAAQGSGGNVGIYLYKYGDGKIPNNSDWSYSADIKGTGGLSAFGIEQSDKNPIKGSIGSEWSRISQTGHVGEPNVKTIIMYFDTKDSPLDVYIKLPKLETGTMPTDWTPAPEDIESALAQVKITADGVSSIVSNPTTGLSTRVQTAEGTLNTVKSTADGAMSKASQTANDITKEISDRKTGDNNTLQSSKDFTQSSITSAVNGVNSTITQTSDSLIAKINTKTDSDTVLSLLKDNWSIGITDNIGKITSGIVGNASQMSLISKNVIIDSPSTQITGTAWINSAMIGNGAIVNANIADAAITSAKIAQLDVAKLTGNVSSFIQSNWNGTYGSTTITSSGLSVQSGSMTTLFDSSGAHFAQGTRTAQYSFGNWIDNTGAITSSTGLGIGLTGDYNSFVNIVGASGASVALVASSNMDRGANANIVNGAINLFADTNIRSKLLFKGNNVVTSTYIEANEIARTMNFYTDNAKDGNGNWFWFNHKVLSTGTFSSTSLLSKKNVIADYEEDALSEISKTDIVEFEYKNDVGEKHISPIIDDVNDKKDYYIPKTILGQDEEYVDMYSMISMAWKAIQQLNDRLEKLESR